MNYDPRINPTIRVSAISLEQVRDVDFYMPESFKQQSSDLNYKLDIFIRIVENISSRYPDVNIESYVSDLSESIVASMINYFHDFEPNEEIGVGIQNYIRYVNDFLLKSIEMYKNYNVRSRNRIFRNFIGIVSNNSMDVFDYGIGFDITSERYGRGYVEKPQDVIMNIYWRER